jgi:hypothetical protein
MEILIECYDWDRFKPSDLIGTVKVCPSSPSRSFFRTFRDHKLPTSGMLSITNLKRQTSRKATFRMRNQRS